MKRDNSTLKEKVALRRLMLRRMAEAPVILETHGGRGHLWTMCYSSVTSGVVFGKNPERAASLARQRPTWAVYEADCVGAIQAGAGAHLNVNVLDVDPYGEPWPVIGAFFESDRPRADRLFVVVNDGLRLAIKQGRTWSAGLQLSMVAKYGDGLFSIYLEACQEMMTEQATKAGYSLTAWAGYYCGHAKAITHYLAELERQC